MALNTTIGFTVPSSSSGAVSKTSAVAPTLEARRPPALPTDRNPAVSAEDMARSYANIAEGAMVRLSRAIESYERYKSDEHQEFLNSESFKRHVEQIRQRHGDEAAAMVLRNHSPEAGMARARRQIEVSEEILRAHFNVSGSLYNYDAKADSYSVGQFSLAVDAGYFAVKVDSQTGPAISVEGGAFRRDFVRNYLPDASHLPYEILGQELLEVLA